MTESDRHSALGDHPNPNIERLVPQQICRAFSVIPYELSGNLLSVASPSTDNAVAAQVLKQLTGHDVRLVQHDPAEISAALDIAFSRGPALLFADADAGSAVPLRTGEFLASLGLVDERDVEEALVEQARTGAQLGEILVASGKITEDDLVAVLAEKFKVQRVSLDGFNPDREIALLLPEQAANALRCVPVARDGDVVFLAVSRPLDDHEVSVVGRYLGELEVRELLATRSSIDTLLQRVYQDDYSQFATHSLMELSPENSAYIVATKAQKTFFISVLVAIIVCGVIWPKNTLIGLVAAASVYYLAVSLYKFRLTFRALGHHFETDVTAQEVADVDERTLPMYTILVPLFREASIVNRLVTGVNGLDYPKTKLDVKLLCEEEDTETIEAIRDLGLPPHFRLVVVPDSNPKTKPKACNYGLTQAEGKYTVIYDAEDRPDPDQLKKAVIAFSKAEPRVTCIQAKLNYFNQDQNLLTKWFSSEYSMHYDLILPGLDGDDVPIPLGGTSNHFITARLRELGAWDPYNVTEDADLGIRLARAGYRTSMMDSTTLEEANSQLPNWVRQRSRWIKGYMQTWLVHMRNPFKTLKDMGLKNFISFNLLVGGTFIFLLNPIFWALTTLFALTQWGFIESLFPGFVFYAASSMLFIGNFVFVYLNVAGSMQRGYFELTKSALLTPLYWGLMSWAAWKGFIQLFTNPFYWEKTEHGLDTEHTESQQQVTS
ncbi:glycosyltransferase [Aeromicrobium sp. YC3-14]|nr:glycosyltransferase [Aeromicrobium stalagmiti]